MTPPHKSTSNLTYQNTLAELSESGIHDWYQFVYSFSDQIISDCVEEFDIGQDDLLLDPFNGTGTTTLAAKQLGIDAIGTDTSPVSVLSGRAKTHWSVNVTEFCERRSQLVSRLRPLFKQIRLDGKTTLETFTEGDREELDLSSYDFSRPQKIPTGWLSQRPLRKMCVLRRHINELPDDPITDLLRLAMVAILPEDVGNVRFGPEATRDQSHTGDKPVLHIYQEKLREIHNGLQYIQSTDRPESGTEIFQADARDLVNRLDSHSQLLDKHGGSVDYLITSPPYPAEHDYTRNQRLELIWLGVCDNNSALQKIKKRNIRSHTKNIYVEDNEAEQVDIRQNSHVDTIVSKLERIIDKRNVQHGFGQTYPRVIEEYFAGMQIHLEQVFELLRPGGKAAYVVGDSGSYWQVEIETAKILAELAENRVGFQDATTRLWRTLRATTATYDTVGERILVLTKPPAHPAE